jgi:WD40 repeat protein
MTIENLRQIYNNSKNNYGISSNFATMTAASMAKKYLDTASPSYLGEINTQPLEDYIYYYGDGYLNGGEQVLLRYESNFYNLIIQMIVSVHDDESNPYAQLVAAFGACLLIDAAPEAPEDDDVKFKAILERSLISSIVSLIEMVKVNRDMGASDVYGFADLFVTIIKNIPSSLFAGKLALSALMDEEKPDEHKSVNSIDTSMWELLDLQPNGTVASLPISWISHPEFIFIERIRNTKDISGSDEEILRLYNLRGTAFEKNLRDSDDRLLLPNWLTVSSFAIHETSGRFVFTGAIKKEFFGLSEDEILSSTLYLFLEVTQFLWIGSTKNGAIAPIAPIANNSSVDISQTENLIGAVISLGGVDGVVVTFDNLGVCRVLTVLSHLSGNETITFSPDGKWLLISSTSTDHGCRLVEVESGRWVDSGVANATWWPLADSTLFTIESDIENAVNTPRLFSLEENKFVQDFPSIVLNVPHSQEYPHIWSPCVKSDGSEVLGETIAGISEEYRYANGAGSRPVRIDLETGNGALVFSPFIDDEQKFERDDEEIKWTDCGRSSVSTRLHPDLVLKEPLTEHKNLPDRAKYPNGAESVLVAGLNRFIEKYQTDDTANLVPPVISSLLSLVEDADAWERQQEWITGLAGAISQAIQNGEITGHDAVAWDYFVTSVNAINQDNKESISILNTIWV